MEYKLAESDYRFMCIVWEYEPLSSMELVKKANEILGWKKSTTFTILRKMAEKGYLINQNSTVTSLVPKEDVQKSHSEHFVEETFKGSLPSFLVTFLGDKTLSKEEADELTKLIQQHAEKR